MQSTALTVAIIPLQTEKHYPPRNLMNQKYALRQKGKKNLMLDNGNLSTNKRHNHKIMQFEYL